MSRVPILDGRLKLRHLMIVVAVADHGGFVRSAEQLHVTQPVVSRAVGEVEAILGVSLFSRMPRGAVPTVHGASFVAHARSIIAQLERAAQHVEELSSTESGQLAIGTHLSGADPLLPRAIQQLRSHRSGVEIRLIESPPGQLLPRLSSGELDLIVGRVHDHQPVAGVREIELYIEPIVLVARAGHPAAGFDRPSLTDLARYPWVVPGPETPVGFDIHAVVARHGTSLPRGSIVATSLSVPEALVLESDFLVPLPAGMTGSDPRFQAVACAEFTLTRTIGIILSSEVSTTPVVDLMLVLLSQEASALVEGGLPIR